MVDERLDILLHALERSPEPGPAFAEQLYRQLAAQAGFGAVRGSWADRLPRAWRSLGISLRLVWLVLLVLLLLLALLGFIAAGGAPRRPHLGVGPPTAAATPVPLTSPLPSNASETGRPAGSLVVGQQPPAWSATLLDGSKFESAELMGRPAAVFLWCSCSPGPEARLFAAEATARAGQVALVLASLDEPETTRGLADWLGFDGTVVADGWPLLDSWGLSQFPALVLLGPDGASAGVQPGIFSAARLGEILDALEGGEGIPEPDPPFASGAPGGDPLSTILQVGQLAPELSGPGLDGKQLSTVDLRGRPSLVLHWIPPDAAGQPRDDTPNPDALIAELDARASTVNGLLVAQRYPADAAAYLAAQDSGLPVIHDWSGELFAQWGLVYWPTVVALDAAGRVVALGDQRVIADPVPFIEAKLLTSGNPVPSGE